jgi:hypothetical protein
MGHVRPSHPRLAPPAVAPASRPVATAAADALADETYRLARCLVAHPDAAAWICGVALAGVRGRRLAAATDAVRLAVFRRVVVAARTRHTPRMADLPLPELGALLPPARELMALELACGLRPGTAARVLRLDAPAARATRRAALDLLLAHHRDVGGAPISAATTSDARADARADARGGVAPARGDGR